jgi:hypothetical protein
MYGSSRLEFMTSFASIFTLEKICDKPLLQNTRIFPDDVFSGSGGPNYQNARLTRAGWCASGSKPYLSINLKKEYHLTQVVVITHNTQRSSRYSLTYRRAADTWISMDRAVQVFVTVILIILLFYRRKLHEEESECLMWSI